MAIDTRDRRASAMMPASGGVFVMPQSDGNLGGQNDRQHMALIYRAIDAGGQVVEEIGGFVSASVHALARALTRPATR